MALTKPFVRIVRPFVGGEYLNDTFQEWYLNDHRHAQDSTHYIRSYHLLEKELLSVFEYVEPHNLNLGCFSHRIYALLLRASTEFEANARVILTDNGYASARQLTARDYWKIEAATRLSDCEVILPVWGGGAKHVAPFREWKTSHTLGWYQAYNAVKHDRSVNFSQASLENAINAVAGVLAILFAQVHVRAFDPHHDVTSIQWECDVWSHDQCFFSIKLPRWNDCDCYDFDWKSLKHTPAPFNAFGF
ncbi:MAG: hypothetical protein ACXW1U_21315 [Methylobacter sp.]